MLPSSCCRRSASVALLKTPECAVASGVFSRPEFLSTYGKTCELVTGLYVALSGYGAKPRDLPNHAHKREKGGGWGRGKPLEHIDEVGIAVDIGLHRAGGAARNRRGAHVGTKQRV